LRAVVIFLQDEDDMATEEGMMFLFISSALFFSLSDYNLLLARLISFTAPFSVQGYGTSRGELPD